MSQNMGTLRSAWIRTMSCRGFSGYGASTTHFPLWTVLNVFGCVRNLGWRHTSAVLNDQGRSMDKMRVFVAFDHALLRKMLRDLIQPQADMEVVGEGASVPEVL